MRKFFTIALFMAASTPLLALAQSTDDSIIAELLRSLDGPYIKPVATTSAQTPAAPKSQQSSAPAQTQQNVLTPGYLFNLEGNAPEPDPTVSALQATVQLLMSQYAAIASSTPTPASATTTPERPATPPMVYKRNLAIGSRGDDVSALQKLLIAHGLLYGEPTGYFGILTKTAVASFQTEQGLEPVGTVGPKTRAILNALPADFIRPTPPPVSFGIPSVPHVSSSTSMTVGTTSTSTANMGSSTPMFDWLAPPVSVTMSLLPTESPIGGSTAVTWIAQNATTCEASDGWSGPKPTIGAARIEPLNFSLNFVLTCIGPGGIASTSALVVVGGEQ